MLFGAQLYSLRDKCTDEAGVRETYRRIKEMGYECVQISGGAALSGETYARILEENGLTAPTTHTAFDLIVNKTDEVIAAHKAIGADVVGLGALPVVYRDSVAGVRSFIETMKEPVRKIREAGLNFGYHNHNFEFEPLEDTTIFELLFSETDWDFIPDVYWMTKAGEDPVALLYRLRGRVTYMHLKDMDPKDDGIIACGMGKIDFAPIIKVCEEIGVRGAFVEQDNAPDLPGGSYEQMAIGARLMRPMVKHEA